MYLSATFCLGGFIAVVLGNPRQGECCSSFFFSFSKEPLEHYKTKRKFSTAAVKVPSVFIWSRLAIDV